MREIKNNFEINIDYQNEMVYTNYRVTRFLYLTFSQTYTL
ncbi:hypothetical protein HMPREF9130_0453 [Peptoniphilus sp. oral taxon 375 str. F0436]|nr:hypothetical protein HMPREF9130_0453 [Peptoniphilus sp. oral taxon 375 str. F0436]